MSAAEPASIVGSVPDKANGAIPAESQSPVDEAGMDKLRSLLLGPAEKQLADVHARLDLQERQRLDGLPSRIEGAILGCPVSRGDDCLRTRAGIGPA